MRIDRRSALAGIAGGLALLSGGCATRPPAPSAASGFIRRDGIHLTRGV